jgi:hypothetical protein
MSPLERARSSRRAPTWLLVLLCISLLAWRLNSRIEQYHPSTAASTAAVAFFDANERNITSLEASREPSHPAPRQAHTLVSLDRPQPRRPQPIDRDRLPHHPVLPAILIHTATLFSNPPPSSLA